MIKESDKKVITEMIEFYGKNNSAIIPTLQAIQEVNNYIPVGIIEYLSQASGVTNAKIYGVATFYENFSFDPKGKYTIKVCDGTACHVRKSTHILDDFYKKLSLSKTKKTTDDMMFTVETVSCLGACGLAPVITINEKVYPTMNNEKVSQVIDELKN